MAPNRGRKASLRMPLAEQQSQAVDKQALSKADSSCADPVPLALQQSLLDVFSIAFPNMLSQIEQTLPALVQEVKSHLYNRNFTDAFGRLDYLEAYAFRWSSSRAIAYLQIFGDVYPSLTGHAAAYGLVNVRNADDGLSIEPSINITCLGGGLGAELCALAGLQRLLLARQPHVQPLTLNIKLLDVADCSKLINTLYAALTAPAHPQAYALAACRAASAPFVVPDTLLLHFYQTDLLQQSGVPAIDLQNSDDGGRFDPLSDNVKDSKLITLMFTLNELYAKSVPATQAFLLHLSTAARPGTLFLVVDSPGSYSTVMINGREKRYPMHWLLDHTLLRLASAVDHVAVVQARTSTSPEVRVKEHDCKDRSLDHDDEKQDAEESQRRRKGKPCWEKLISDGSRWFRLSHALRYPIVLENMRYQIHLYQRL